MDKDIIYPRKTILGGGKRLKNAMYEKALRHIKYAIKILITWNPEKTQEAFDFFVIWLQNEELERD